MSYTFVISASQLDSKKYVKNMSESGLVNAISESLKNAEIYAEHLKLGEPQELARGTPRRSQSPEARATKVKRNQRKKWKNSAKDSAPQAQTEIRPGRAS